MTARRSDGGITGVGGVPLHYRAWEASTPRAAIVLLHGLGEHAGRYEAFAQRLAAWSFSTYALDQRGHGLSDGRRGHVSRFDAFLQDAERFRREVAGLVDPRLPLFLLGQSMGGLIALRYQEEYPGAFAGAVICSPWLATAMPVPRWKVTLANLVAPLLPALPLDNQIEPAHLSHDPEVVQAYRTDPLVHRRITPRLFAETSAAMGLVFQRADRLCDPLLFLIAGDDRVVDAARTQQVTARLPAGLATVRVYPGMFHEVLNEVGREGPLRDLRDWIAARIR